MLCCLGKCESTVEKLRAILAQLEFQHLEQLYHDARDVLFRSHLYVPEVHPVTNLPFCEREDEGHVLKVTMLCMHTCTI